MSIRDQMCSLTEWLEQACCRKNDISSHVIHFKHNFIKIEILFLVKVLLHNKHVTIRC